jgi:FkbM family methyltransferase
MNKIITYTRYLLSYLKNKDFGSIKASINFLLKRPTHKTDRIIQSSIGTFYCRKNTNDFQFANYYYEWSVKKKVLELLPSISVFIDGGACTGDYSVLLAKKGIRCFAFEPVHDTFRVLKKNLELNDLLEKVKAYSFGLGNTLENARFEINTVNTGASHKTVKTSGSQEIVEIRTFDSILPELAIRPEDSILLKLDVEGMEVEAIQGAKNFIREYHNLILIVEMKHCGPRMIEETLNSIAPFTCKRLDAFNLIATRIN